MVGDEQSFSAYRNPNTAILFDAVGTLIFADPSPAEAYERHGCRFGSRLTVDEIATRFRAAFAAQETIDLQDSAGRTSEERERCRWQTIVRRTFVDLADTATLFEALWNHFAQPSSWRAFDDARELIPALVAEGVIIGVASNFDARLPAIIAKHFPGIPRERVFVSSHVGHRKPAKEFFDYCLRELAVEAVTLVGDDLENDFTGASRAGWRAVLLDRANRYATFEPRVVDLRSFT